MAGQMGTHKISLRGLVRRLDTISKARLKNLNQLTTTGTTGLRTIDGYQLSECSSSSILRYDCFNMPVVLADIKFSSQFLYLALCLKQQTKVYC